MIVSYYKLIKNEIGAETDVLIRIEEQRVVQVGDQFVSDAEGCMFQVMELEIPSLGSVSAFCYEVSKKVGEE